MGKQLRGIAKGLETGKDIQLFNIRGYREMQIKTTSAVTTRMAKTKSLERSSVPEAREQPGSYTGSVGM